MTIIGTTGSYQNNGNTEDKAFTATGWFDAPSPNGNWVGQDFGSVQALSGLSWSPRPNFPQRLTGGLFQTADDAAFTINLKTIYTIITPQAGSTTFNPPISTRYLRYLGPDGSYCNISNLIFNLGPPVPANLPTGITTIYDTPQECPTTVFVSTQWGPRDQGLWSCDDSTVKTGQKGRTEAFRFTTPGLKTITCVITHLDGTTTKQSIQVTVNPSTAKHFYFGATGNASNKGDSIANQLPLSSFAAFAGKANTICEIVANSVLTIAAPIKLTTNAHVILNNANITGPASDQGIFYGWGTETNSVSVSGNGCILGSVGSCLVPRGKNFAIVGDIRISNCNKGIDGAAAAQGALGLLVDGVIQIGKIVEYPLLINDGYSNVVIQNSTFIGSVNEPNFRFDSSMSLPVKNASVHGCVIKQAAPNVKACSTYRVGQCVDSYDNVYSGQDIGISTNIGDHKSVLLDIRFYDNQFNYNLGILGTTSNLVVLRNKFAAGYGLKFTTLSPPNIDQVIYDCDATYFGPGKPTNMTRV